MTPRELDDVRAEPIASDSPRPLGINKLIVAANHVSRTNRRKFGKREWKRVWESRLGPKAFDGRHCDGIVAVGANQFPGKLQVNPSGAQLIIGCTQTLDPTGIQHIGLVLQLIQHAASNVWHQGT